MFTTLSSICVYSQNYHVYNFNNEEYLPQPYIYTINQDNLGYLWIGTGNGLVKYNGYTFKTYTTSDSLADNFITCSFKTKNGIWFGHMNGDLTYYNEKIFKPVNIDTDNKTMITDIEKDWNDNIIISNYANGLRMLKSDKSIKKITIQDTSLSSISAFKIINKTQFLIGTDNGLLAYAYDGANNLTFKEKITNIPEEKITDIIKIPKEDSYLIATRNEGVFKINLTALGFKIVKLCFNLNIDVTGIEKLIFDNERNLWVATMGQGLLKFKFISEDKLDVQEQFNSENRQYTDYTKNIFEDREGIIWSGTYGNGLNKIIKKHYSYAFFDENLIGNINAMIVDSLNMWIGTNNGLYIIKKNVKGTINLINEVNYLPNKTVTSLFNSGKYIWIGTKANGVYKLNKNEKNIISNIKFSGGLENSITALTGNESELWIGTLKGVCHINENDSIKWYTINKGGLPNNHINKVILDKKGKALIASSSSTYSVIENGIVNNTFIPMEDKLSGIKTLILDSKENIWVGTLGKGLFKLESDSIVQITSNDGLYSDYCYSVAYDGNENIWVGHHGGLSQVNVNSLKVNAINEKFEILKKYEFSTNAIATDKSNSVYFGFQKGIIKVNTYDKIESLPPLLNIIGVKINDKKVEVKDEINLTSGKYKLRIDFIGINLKEPYQTKYHYILEGYDDKISVTSGNHVVYQQLSSGEYTFRLQAINSNGIVSNNSIIMKLNINPPFWKLPSFYLIVMFLTFIIVIWRINRQKRIIKLKNIILEKKVKERTAEISNQKDQIEKQNELIEYKNKNITDSIIYASRIQKAILTPLKKVKSIIPNSFVLYMPKDIVSGDFYLVKKVNHYTIIVAADCTGHGVPGAFMSILGISYLDEIVQRREITKPNQVLNELRKQLIHSLRQYGAEDESKDGIDLALCVIDTKKNQMQYSGAYNPLYIVKEVNGVPELNEIKADRMPVGIHYGKEKDFTNHEIQIEMGDTFYIFSDGFADQIGGKENRKFLSRNFKKLLLEIYTLPIDEQKEVLCKTINEWMDGKDQLDDILIMGIKM